MNRSTQQTPSSVAVAPSYGSLVCIGLAAIVAVAWPIASSTVAEWEATLRVGGRLHVAAIHFPITLILVAGVFVLVGGGTRRPLWTRFAHECGALGAAACLIAAGTGWSNAHFEPYGGSLADTLFWHRWLGVGVAVSAVGAAFLARRLPRASLAVLVLNAALVGWVGHLGGSIVHGPDYFVDPLRTDPITGEAPPSVAAESPSPEPAASPDEPASGPATSSTALSSTHEPSLYGHVEEILAAHCLDCHGPRKQKGKLRLDAPQWLFVDREFPTVVPGEPEQSELYLRITLPPDDDDFMPQKADPLSAADVEVIHDWIATGASVAGSASTKRVDGTAAEVEAVSASASAAVVAAPPVDPEIMEALREQGVLVRRLAADLDEYWVSFRPVRSSTTDAQLELLAKLASNLVELDLTACAVTSSGIGQLGGFSRLRHLRLGRTQIDNDCFDTLQQLGALEVLDVHSTAVTDDAVDAIAQLAALKRVYCWNSSVTAEGAARLRKLRPDLQIDLGGQLPPERPRDKGEMRR